MKTLHICSGLVLGALLSGTAYGQQQDAILASAQPAPKDGTISAPEGEGKEKKEDEKTFTISGSIDTYFRSTLGTRNVFPVTEDATTGDLTPALTYGPSTSFSDLKGFGLGMANIIASYSGE